ncbi:MAG: hypothetical protein HZR80_15445 [Candidatus Heimdallarchaeota archaeon]
MVAISRINRTDRNLIGLIVASIIITSFVWIGDVASWAYLGNGFVIDFVLLIIAILLTLGTIFLIRFNHDRKVSSARSTETQKKHPAIESEKKSKVRSHKKATLSCSSCGELFPVNETHCSILWIS